MGRSAAAKTNAFGFVLHFLKNGQEVRTHEIKAPQFTVGSADECTVRAKSTSLAPLHATVFVENGQAVIVAGPGLTVKVNGQPTARSALVAADLVRVGPVTFSLELVGAEPAGPVAVERPDEPEPDSEQTSPVASGAPLFSVDVIHPQLGMARYDLAAGTVTVGRSRESVLVLDDPAIGRRHAVVEVGVDGVFVKDLGSAGGTFLNGRRITEEFVKMGDVLGIGTFTIIVREAPAAIRPVPTREPVRAMEQKVVEPARPTVPPVIREVTPPIVRETPPPRSVPPSPRTIPPAPRSIPPAARSIPPAARSIPPAPRSIAPAAPSVAPTIGSPSVLMVKADGPRFAPQPALDTVGFLIAAYPTPAPSNRPPVLEVTRIWNDEALELRAFAPGSKVTVGTKRGTYVFEDADIPGGRFPLVSSERGQWILSVKDGWNGFVDAGGGPATRVAIQQWVAASGAQPDANGVRRVVLVEGSHVALHVGSFTLLLRLVRPETRLPAPLVGRFDPQFATAMAVPAIIGLILVLAYFLMPVPPEPPISENPPDRFVELLKAPKPPPTQEKKKVADEKSSDKSKSERNKQTHNDTPMARTKQVNDIVSKLTKKVEREDIKTSAPAATRPAFNIAGLIGDLPAVNVDRASTSLITKGSGELGTKQLTQLQAAQRGPVRGAVTKLTSAAKVTGSLSREDVTRVINEHTNQLSACYEKVLITDSGVSGKIALDWTVKMDGTVKDVRVSSSTLSNPKVATCVVDAVKTWKFPNPVGGEAMISYPFLFRSN